MPQPIALRVAGLAAVTLVAAVVALALTSNGGSKAHHQQLPRAVGGWYHSLATPYTASVKSKRGACGVVIGAATMGVANPVLPCGVKIYVAYGGTQVLTQVIDRGPDLPGRQFDLTRGLAAELGLTGTRTIHWRFAR